MSIAEDKRNQYTRKPLSLSLSANEIRLYHWMAEQYYSTQEALEDIIDIEFYMSDIAIGKFKLFQ